MLALRSYCGKASQPLGRSGTLMRILMRLSWDSRRWARVSLARRAAISMKHCVRRLKRDRSFPGGACGGTLCPGLTLSIRGPLALV
jgi:hypothetical protein